MKKQIQIHSTQYLIIYLQDAKKKKKKVKTKMECEQACKSQKLLHFNQYYYPKLII